MKNLRIILMTALFCCSVSFKAQNNNDSLQLYRENYNLKKELNNKKSIITQLEHDLAQMKMEKTKVDSLLRMERTLGRSKELKSQIQELENENKRLLLALNECTSGKDATIDRLMLEGREQVARLQQQHIDDSIAIVSLRADLSELSNFRKMWIAQLAESVNERWLEKPYSQINIQELENALKQYDEFASSDKRIADALDKLKVLLKDCQIYNQGIHIVNALYEKERINSILVPLKSLRDKTTDPTKKKELSLLYWQLDNYGVTIEIFQDVIKAVDEQILGLNAHKAAWPLVKAVLDKQEKDDEYITAIKKIPWLSKQYDAYYQSLERNCVGTNRVRDMIMNLHP